MNKLKNTCMTVKSIKLLKTKVIRSKKGSIIKYLNKKEKFFSGFGEIYFSEIKLNKTKGWNYHKKYTCIITVPSGQVEFLIINNKNKLIRKKISKNKLLVIPPKNWFAFKSLKKNSIVANLINGVHSNKETKKSNIIKNIEIT